jgi:predicted outer membrane protein
MKSLLALALCGALTSVVSAQVVQTSGQRELQSTSTAANSSQVDNRVASCLILANLGEIELAKFGEENLEDGEAKKFAKMLVEDHKKLVKELERFAPQAASTELSSDNNSSNRNQQQRSTQQAGTNITPGFDNPSSSQQTAAQNPTDQKLFQIEKEAVQNCVSMTKEELQEKQGKDMDKAFVGCQIGSHIHMLASLKAAENNVSPELQQVIAKAQDKVQSHLDKAKQLMKEQEKS